MSHPEQYEPVSIHLASAAPGVLGGKKGHRYKAVYETVTLTANDPAQNILPQDASREIAYIQAIDNDIVIGPSAGVVGAGVNTATGTPNPNGTLVPKANTAPWPVCDCNAVFAGVTTTASNSRVSVAAYYRA